MFSFEVIGLNLIERKLKNMEPKLAKKIVRSSLRKAAKPVLQAAKANCPYLSGDLKKSLKVRALKKRKHSYAVGVSSSNKKHWYKGDQFYAAFIEFGTNKMPARPFLRSAYDTQGERARKILINELKAGIAGATK